MAEPDLYNLTPVDGNPHKTSNTVGGAIDTAAAKYGLNPAVLKGIASIESSWDPESNKKKPSTQYKGLFQMGEDEWKKYGKGDIYNAQDNADAAAHMLRDHSDWFKTNYGSDPTPGDLYMMHQQGRGFIKNGTMTNIGGNPYPGMKGSQTPESFRQGWSDELARRTARYGDGSYATDGSSQTAAVASAPNPGTGGTPPPSQSPSTPTSQDDQLIENLLKKTIHPQAKAQAPMPTMSGPMTFTPVNGNPFS